MILKMLIRISFSLLMGAILFIGYLNIELFIALYLISFDVSFLKGKNMFGIKNKSCFEKTSGITASVESDVLSKPI